MMLILKLLSKVKCLVGPKQIQEAIFLLTIKRVAQKSYIGNWFLKFFVLIVTLQKFCAKIIFPVLLYSVYLGRGQKIIKLPMHDMLFMNLVFSHKREIKEFFMNYISKHFCGKSFIVNDFLGYLVWCILKLSLETFFGFNQVLSHLIKSGKNCFHLIRVYVILKMVFNVKLCLLI